MPPGTLRMPGTLLSSGSASLSAFGLITTGVVAVVVALVTWRSAPKIIVKGAERVPRGLRRLFTGRSGRGQIAYVRVLAALFLIYGSLAVIVGILRAV